MPDQRILNTEELVGANHATKADTLNRLALVEHNNDGTHKAPIGNFTVDHNTNGTHKKPSFSAHKGGVNQVIISATWTKLTWDAEEFDTNNNFALGTFTPTVAGKYLLSATVYVMAPVDNMLSAIAIYKNGILFKDRRKTSAGTLDDGVGLSFIFDANGTTDFFEVFFYHTAGVDKSISGAASQSYFGGCRID